MTIDIAETAQILEPAPGLFVRQAVDNITWADMGDYILVVDALEQPELEHEIMGAIERTVGQAEVRCLINTHTHYDHVALNDAFRRRFDTEIVNKATSVIPDEGRWFSGPRRRAAMIPMVGCHTDEDCVVWFPGDRVLLVGDIFGWGIIPLVRRLDRDSLRLLEDTYTRLIELGAETVVPGHGPLCTALELRRWLDYLHDLIDTVRAACQAGRSDERILAETAAPPDMHHWWRFLKWKHADSVQKVLRSVRKGLL